jgi:predicted GNAT family acetyltransferase
MRIVNGMVAGGVADFTVFDGHEERLSDLVESFPSLSNPVTRYLKSDENDTELEGRMKSVLEGAGVGALFEGFIATIRGIRAARRARAVTQAVEDVQNRTIDLPDRKTEVELESQREVDKVAAEVTDEGRLEIDTEEGSTLILEKRKQPRTVDEKGLGADEAGKIELMERGGRTLQVINVVVEQASRRLGKGKALYDAAVKQADERGLILTSDSSVSQDAAKQWDRMAAQGDEIIDQRITNPDNIETVKGQIQTKNGTPVFERTRGAAKEAVEELDEAAQGAKAADEAATIQLREKVLKRTIELSTQQKEAFLRAVREGDEEAASAVMKDFNENNIDFAAIENGADIKEILLTTERMFADMIDEVKGGKQSNVKTKILANLVDASPREINQLFRDVRGDKGLAARFYAAQRVMLASADNVRRKAEAAWKAPGDNRAQAEALQAVQSHAAIQAEVKGAQTEIARALQAMSMLKDDMAAGFREFDELRRNFAPAGGGKTAWERYMDDLVHSKDLSDLNSRVKWTNWTRAKNIFIEYVINGMLSSGKTHVINFTSNVLNTFMYSFDRSLGGAYRAMRHGDKAALREAKLDWMGKFGALDEAWKLAKNAFKEGLPQTDKRQRIEFETRKAIGSDQSQAEYFTDLTNAYRKVMGQADRVVANEGTTFQKAINTLGTIVRFPGRLLITGDEFFKAINRNAEIGVLSFRQADDEAIRAGFEYGSKKYEAYVKRRMSKLSDMEIRDPENIRIQSEAIEKARLTTFQEAPRTDFGSAAEGFINSNWAVKLIIAPFFRTPMNIVRQGLLDRTPLGWFIKEHRRVLNAGGREAAEMHARMLSGVGAFTAFYALSSSGEEGDGGFELVGKLPFDSASRLMGINDYSIRIGDNWYQFNRLEPMGMWLGMIADMRTLTKYRQDEEAAFTFGQAAIFSFLNNVTNKTYMKSISDIQDMLEGVASGSEATASRAINRFTAGEFGKLIPQLYKGAARALEGDDESQRAEVWTFLDILADRSSTFNEGLAPRFDVVGRPIDRDSGLSILINPFAMQEHSDDPVDQEFWRLGFSIQPMRKTLGAEQVVLTAAEYSKMNGFLAEPLKLHETLTTFVNDPSYEQLPDPLKIATIKKIINKAREGARALILTDDTVLKRVTQEKTDAAFMLTGEN